MNSVRADTPPNSPYTGTGNNLDVSEFARNDSITFSDGVNSTAFTYSDSWFPLNYRGYRLQTQVRNLSRTENPAPNGDFDQYGEPFHIDGTQIGEEVHNWTLSLN